MPRGRSLPFFFGIYTRRAGANRYRSNRISSMISLIIPSDIPSAVSPQAPGVIYYWIENGQLAARRNPSGRLCIPWTPAIEADCHARIASSGHLNPAARHTRPNATGFRTERYGV